MLGRPAWILLGGVGDPPPWASHASAPWFHQDANPTAHYGNALLKAQEEGFTVGKAEIGLGVDDSLEIRGLGAATKRAMVMFDANQYMIFTNDVGISPCRGRYWHLLLKSRYTDWLEDHGHSAPLSRCQ